MFTAGEIVTHKKGTYTVGYCRAGITELLQDGKRVKCVLTDTVKTNTVKTNNVKKPINK